MIDAKLFTTQLVRNYYSSAKPAVDALDEREFGFGNFDTKIAMRHLAFKSSFELSRYLVRTAPMFVSYSAAYYTYPDARPIENKQRKGSELIFDLDSTDLELQCQKTHDRKWVCPNCMQSIKEETIKLIEDFLVPDFGFSEREMELNFSGNRGYHIHVKSPSVLNLNVAARKDVSNYIAGAGISFSEFFPTGGEKGLRLSGPKPSDTGWHGKIARSFISRLDKGPSALEELGIDPRTAKSLHRKKALIILGINNGNWDLVYIKNKADFWKRILKKQSVNQADKIDTHVTGDITRLIRMPDTIHGGTGLLAKRINSKSDLDKYDPMKECIVMPKGEAKIIAKETKEFIMNDESFKLEKGKEAKLPVYAAVFSFLKGIADIVDADV